MTVGLGDHRETSLLAVKAFTSTSHHLAFMRSLDQEDPLEKEMATHSSNLAWRIPRDRGAWWATVRGAAKSRTRLKLLRALMSMSCAEKPRQELSLKIT